MKRSIIAIFAIATLIIGVAIPVYFGATSQTLIDNFEDQSVNLEEDIQQFNAAGKYNAADILSHIQQGQKTLRNNKSTPDTFDSRILFDTIDNAKLNYDNTNALPYFVNSKVRAQLKSILSNSINQSTLHFLETSNYSGWEFFLPVASNSGAPLESTILASALMVEEQAFSDRFLMDFKEKYNCIKIWAKILFCRT